MVIRQRIENVLSLPAELDQVHLFEQAKLVGNGTLTDFHGLGYVCYTQLPLHQ